MAVRYQVRLKSTTGQVVAIFDDWRRLAYSHRVNAPGALEFAINGADSRVDLFSVDGQIEVWRSDQVNGLDWYAEWEGALGSSSVRSAEGDGRKAYTDYSAGYLDLLSRRTVAYKSTTVQAEKSGVGSTVIRAYVHENAGDLATVANGRLAAGGIAGLTIGTDPVAGDSWRGARAYRNLLEVIQGIADATGVDFDIIGTGPATMVFMLFAGQRGEDRTVTGKDLSTGENAAGNAPVVFALEYGNMATPQYALSRSGSANRVFVLGQGEGTSRTVAVRGYNEPSLDDLSSIATWSLREISRNATNETTLAGLNAVGDTVLRELQPRESFDFDVLQLPALFYGKHYSWGDRVTARYGSIERNKRIVGVQVSVTESGSESVRVQLADVPR